MVVPWGPRGMGLKDQGLKDLGPRGMGLKDLGLKDPSLKGPGAPWGALMGKRKIATNIFFLIFIYFFYKVGSNRLYKALN